jgi:hypothetical protein
MSYEGEFYSTDLDGIELLMYRTSDFNKNISILMTLKVTDLYGWKYIEYVSRFFMVISCSSNPKVN